MNTLKLILKILIILISCLVLSCGGKKEFKEKTYIFNSKYPDFNKYPIYPKAEPDYSYARAGVYVFSFIYGWDPKNRIIYAYYVDDNMQNVKTFYENIFSEKFECEIEDHENFMKKYWDLFQEYEFPDFEGFFEHCRGPNVDLISPFYHYGKLRWESGTIIVFYPEKKY